MAGRLPVWERPVYRRAAARATALLDAAYLITANEPVRTWTRTSAVRWDDARAAFVFATDDRISFIRAGATSAAGEPGPTFAVPPDVPREALVYLGGSPLDAVSAARRVLREVSRPGRQARIDSNHRRAMDALSVVAPLVGTVANAATRLGAAGK